MPRASPSTPRFITYILNKLFNFDENGIKINKFFVLYQFAKIVSIRAQRAERAGPSHFIQRAGPGRAGPKKVGPCAPLCQVFKLFCFRRFHY